MRKTTTGAVLASLALVIGPVLPAAAAPAAATYHGSWTSANDCTRTAVPLDGVWNVTIRPDGTASVHVTIFKDGALHAVWGGNVWGDRFTSHQSTGTTFDVRLHNMKLALTGKTLTYTLTNFSCSGVAKTLTLFGESSN